MTPEITIRTFSNDQYFLDKAFYSNYYRIKSIGEGSLVVDIGAHVGAFSFSCLIRGANVCAVEPFHDNLRLLMQNTRYFGNQITYLNMGVGYTTALTRGVTPKMGDNKFFDYGGFELCTNTGNDSFPFLTKKLDDIIDSTGKDKIDLLKISTGTSQELDFLKDSKFIDVCEYIVGDQLNCSSDKIKEVSEALKQKGFAFSNFVENEKEGSTLFFFGKKELSEMFHTQKT